MAERARIVEAAEHATVTPLLRWQTAPLTALAVLYSLKISLGFLTWLIEGGTNHWQLFKAGLRKRSFTEIAPFAFLIAALSAASNPFRHRGSLIFCSFSFSVRRSVGGQRCRSFRHSQSSSDAASGFASTRTS